jgi:hypothetical protein
MGTPELPPLAVEGAHPGTEKGFWTGAASASVIGIAGVALVLLVRTI